ncbi:MAG TPA: DUF2281 domain-containing protein [Blastocatellia bacterium]|nr:DUF2281 domain-containing protein [Blastocatellia bacterium]
MAKEFVMTLVETVIEKLKQMPPEKLQEVLDFAEFLERKNAVRQPRRSLEGIWEGMNVSISKEEIDEARREAWANFPREHFYNEEQKA